MKIVWPVCCAISFIYTPGRQKYTPKVYLGMGAKPFKKGGCEGSKMAEVIKVLQDNNM